MKSFTVQSSVKPGATTSSGGKGSRIPQSTPHARSSSWSSSCRLSTDGPLLIGQELEGAFPDHHLVSPFGSSLRQLRLDSLATEPPLELRHLARLVEIGRGHPSFHVPSDDPVSPPFLLHGEALPARAQDQ